MSTIAVVIPAKDEGPELAELVNRVYQYATHVMVVDDASMDGSTLHLSCDVVPMPRSFRRGLASVYRYGLSQALKAYPDADFFIEMDAGGSHQPHQITRFVHWLHSYDVVTGRRFGPAAIFDAPWQRRWLSWLGTLVTNYTHGTEWQDATSGFIGYRRYALSLLVIDPWESEGHYYQTEMRLLAREMGFDMAEVPITYRSSKSSLNWKSVLEAARLSMTWTKGFRLFS